MSREPDVTTVLIHKMHERARRTMEALNRRTRWIPCFNAHPTTGRACQLRGGHDGPHRCGYPGGVDRWTGFGWNRTPSPRDR